MVFGMLCEELGLIVALCAMLAIIALAIFTVKKRGSGPLVVLRHRRLRHCDAHARADVAQRVRRARHPAVHGRDVPVRVQGRVEHAPCWMLLAYIKAADTRRGASFVVRLPSRKNKEAQA